MEFSPNDNNNLPLTKFESMLKTNNVLFFDSEEFENIIHHYLNQGKVALAKKLAGPFAPKTDSFEPLYAPSPMLELFCSKTAITKMITKTIWIISKRLVVIYIPINKVANYI